MKRVRRFLLWTIFFLALLVVTDQLLLKLSLTTPGASQFQTFYRDFRSRLIGLLEGPPATTIDQVIDQAAPPPGKTPAAATPPAARYIYVDGQGQLQFAESLSEVPKAYRPSAQPLKD